MKTKQILILLLFGLTYSLRAADTTNRLNFPASGFSIAPLDGTPGDNVEQALMMFLPVNDRFAANVNVQVQPCTGTIEDYTALTLKQFKDGNMKLISQKKAGTSGVVFEATSELHGRALHFYARAEKCADRIYLATATAAEADWPTQAAQLRACVDSLRCDSGITNVPAAPKKSEQRQ